MEQTYRIGIIPVIATGDAKEVVPLARSLARGGLPTAEVTSHTRAAGGAMWATMAEVPEMLPSAGIALNHEQVDRALVIGAKLAVSPDLNPGTACYVKSKGGLILSGIAIPGEME